MIVPKVQYAGKVWERQVYRSTESSADDNSENRNLDAHVRRARQQNKLSQECTHLNEIEARGSLKRNRANSMQEERLPAVADQARYGRK